MSQLFLFTGENAFELSQEKRRWVQGFVDKHGLENLSRVSGKNLPFQQLLDEVSSAPFIASKRLTLIDGVPKLDKEQMDVFLGALHPDTIVGFIDPKPDKRLSSVKKLLSEAEVKTFAPLVGPKLQQWIHSYAQSLGSEISREGSAELLRFVGEDQQLLSQEIHKLVLFAAERQITAQDVDQLVLCSTEQAGWQLMDLIADGAQTSALAFTKKLMDRGESPHALWNMLLWMVSQMVLVSSAVQEGQTSPQAIVKSTGASFGSARTLVSYVRRISPERLRKQVQYIVQADLDLKTGVYRSTVEAPEELQSLLDACVYDLAQTH